MRKTKNRSRISRLIAARALALLLGAPLLLSGCQSVGAPIRVAVPDFESTLADEKLAHLPQSLAAQLSASLLAQFGDSEATVIERIDLRLQSAGSRLWGFVDPRPPTLQRLGKRLNADYLVIGDISRLEDNFILNSNLFSVATGQVVPGTSLTRVCPREGDLFPSVQSVARFMAYQVRNYAERERIASAQGENEGFLARFGLSRFGGNP